MYQHVRNVNMNMLTISSTHCSAYVQPHRADSVAIDSSPVYNEQLYFHCLIYFVIVHLLQHQTQHEVQ